jgi:putative transposase
VSEAKTNLARYFDFYNMRRPHSRLDGLTPDECHRRTNNPQIDRLKFPQF